MDGVNRYEHLVVGGQIPLVAQKFVANHLDDAGRPVEINVSGPVQGGAQQLVEADQMIDMAVADKDMAGLKNFFGRQIMQISEIKEKSLTTIIVVEEKSRVAERWVEGFNVPGWEQKIFSLS